jgi:hypothetical protein
MVDEHIMELKKKFGDGGQLWECPTCGKQIILHKAESSKVNFDGIIHELHASKTSDSHIEIVDDIEELLRDWNESV